MIDAHGRAAAWVAAAACLPYLVLKVLWTVDVEVGIADPSVLDDTGWVAANAVMALVQLVGLVLVLALVRPWGRRLPVWLLLGPVWVGTGLLFQVVVGAVLVALSGTATGEGTDTGDFEPWVFVVVYASFAVQGSALAVAFAAHVRARWGRLLGTRTAEVVPAGVRPAAEVVAGLALATALVAAYWAAGGSFALSEDEVDVPAAMHASRAVAGVTAAAGLLALAGRWGRGRRLWLPATLAWLGSGALVAMDGFVLVLSRILGATAWTVTDGILVAKAVVGLAAAAVALGAVAGRPNLLRTPGRGKRAWAHAEAVRSGRPGRARP